MTKQASEGRRLDLRLAMSGGGYRAALFHLGALRRLNELGLLSRINHFSSVSGGSIILALLASRIATISSGQAIDAQKWNIEVSAPLHAFCSRNIRTIPLAAYYFTLCLWPKIASRLLERNYERLLLSAKRLKLKDLPDWAAFDINATELKFGVRFGFRRSGVVCHKLNRPPSTVKEIALAKAVTASSSFPPAFPPIILDLSEFRQKTEPSEEPDSDIANNDQAILTDGGVYDNLGLEPIWDRAGARDGRDEIYILVSDGGATIKYQQPTGFLQKFKRYIGISFDQVGILRKRWLLARDGDKADPLKAVIWSVADDTSAGGGFGKDAATVIGSIRTDLDCFSEAERKALENQGYLACDLAIKEHHPILISHDAPEATAPWQAFSDEAVVQRRLKNSHRRFPVIGWFRWTRVLFGQT